MKIITFFVFWLEKLFGLNLVQNIKLVVSAEIWLLDLFESAEFNNEIHFFLFLPGDTFLDQRKKKWSKKSKLSVYGEIWYLVLFKSTEFNSELFYFWLGMPFLIQKWKLLVWKLSRLIRICIFNVLPILFWICRIQWWWHSLFSLFDWEYHFKVNLIQNIKLLF